MLKRFLTYPRFLSDVMRSVDLEIVPSETIMAIWDNLHSQDPFAVTKTISAIQFKRMQERFEQAPAFIYPCITSKNTRITLISEIIEPNCLAFSDIEDDDSFGLMLVRMFPELAEKKDIVPLRGDVINGSLIKAESAKVLQCFVKFYIETDLFNAYVKVFNNQFDEFNYEKFLETYLKVSLEKPIIDSK